MAEIEWADATVNPWWGCTKVSPACKNCYADTLAYRWGKDLWGAGKPREDHRAGARKLAMRLQRQAVAEGRRLRVFCASMADWLDPEVPAEWLADLLALVEATPALDWLLLTKRPHLFRARIGDAADARTAIDAPGAVLSEQWLAGDQPANVWLGCTVEDQEHADERIPALLGIPARVRFLSCEPLLGPVDLNAACARARFWNKGPGASWRPDGLRCGPYALGLLDWIIAGGESGRGARPSHPDWFRSLRDQATSAGVAFFFKQWGEWADAGWRESGRDAPPERACVRIGRAAAGRLIDGRTWDEVPHAP